VIIAVPLQKWERNHTGTFIGTGKLQFNKAATYRK